MQKVFSHENLAILASAKNLLELNGITCLIKNEFHGTGGHVGIDPVLPELWVTEGEDFAKAMELLDAEMKQADQKAEWTCKNCGEINAGSFETCWRCQSE